MKTNNEIVLDVDAKIKNYTRLYFENINSNVSSAHAGAVANSYNILITGVEKVNINLLTKEGQQIVVSEVGLVERCTKAVRPLVRVELPIEKVLEFNENNEYLKSSISGIINSVQKQWEKAFGSYHKERLGKKFFDIENLTYIEGRDVVYLDFTGDWASGEDV